MMKKILKVKQMMVNEEIRDLNDEITHFEIEYWNRKYEYESQRAEIVLGTDFSAVIGKAKPTVAEKDAYIQSQIGDLQLSYRKLRSELDEKKRLFQVMLKELGDSE